MTTLVTPPAIMQETMQLTLSAIGERLAPLRIADPVAERAMLHSLQKFGQQTPVVVCRIAAGKHELLDGFKRLRAGRELGYLELTARPLDVSLQGRPVAAQPGGPDHFRA